MFARSLRSTLIFAFAFSSNIVSGVPLAVEPFVLASPQRNIPGIDIDLANLEDQLSLANIPNPLYEDSQLSSSIISSALKPGPKVVTIEVQGSGSLDALAELIRKIPQKIPRRTHVVIEVELHSGAPILFSAVFIFMLGVYLMYASGFEDEGIVDDAPQVDEEKSSTTVMDLMFTSEEDERSAVDEKKSIVLVDLMMDMLESNRLGPLINRNHIRPSSTNAQSIREGWW
ncbi:hypothetical protein BT96DRAFT_943043 [Gymnopus androsaceus JB14]|uniref:Uncharacterized protein n=1 Tax=Gymnopus androsaceus JB14 TaxID=1447944 RepID=A0A6A4HBF4_9AGAR|nr:hypothetical protein BT96DRAFT_943043 [Gymnopus androsaceus JB14]